MTNPANLAPFLGCATTYTAHIYYWDRHLKKLRHYTELTGLLELTWERVLDDYSEARLRFRPIQGSDCCDKLKPKMDSTGKLLEPGLWPWAHELALYRDGEFVWQGPVFSIDETVLPDETTDYIQITARDFLAWLDRRVIHKNISLSKKAWDLSTIAEAIVRDAFAPDDPGLMPYLTVSLSGRTGKRTVAAWEAKSGDELREVARGGLDFTCVGRRIFIKSPKFDPTKATITLTSRDFLSGIEIRVVGSEAATAGVAIGGVPPTGSQAPAKAYYPAGGPAAGTDPFFGLIENWTQSESVDINLDFLKWIAKQKVIDGYPPPLTLSIPAGSGLTPSSPVSIHHLVPSTYFTVRVAGTCRELVQHMRLSHVSVTWSASQAETVGVSFIPQDVLVGEETSDAP
jgi:hypothetical protein